MQLFKTLLGVGMCVLLIFLISRPDLVWPVEESRRILVKEIVMVTLTVSGGWLILSSIFK